MRNGRIAHGGPRRGARMAGATCTVLVGLLAIRTARALTPSQSIKPPPISYWEPGEARLFVQGRFDVGVPFGKASVAAGYGKPHWIWIGPEAFAITTGEFGALYGGVRASTPVLDVAFGYRDNFSYTRSFLVPRERYTSEDVQTRAGPLARYMAWELELSGLAPALGGYAIWAADIDKVVDAPLGVDLYEESNRVVIHLPWVVALRVGYVRGVLDNGAIKLGAVVDSLIMPGRPGTAWRVGPAGIWSVTDHLDVVGLATVTVASPDELGFFLGTWAVAGVRYKWATGEENPRFP